MNRDLLQLKRAMKEKMCLTEMTPNYPMGELVRWIEQEEIRYAVVLVLLDIIQTELDTEEIILRRSCQLAPDKIHHLALHGYWRLYCSQIHAYYKALVRDYRNKEKLEFLL